MQKAKQDADRQVRVACNDANSDIRGVPATEVGNLHATVQPGSAAPCCCLISVASIARGWRADAFASDAGYVDGPPATLVGLPSAVSATPASVVKASEEPAFQASIGQRGFLIGSAKRHFWTDV